ncbi:MAG: phage Gp37/Gp68 family protein [Rhodopirellula sp.]|nr:phage Gp37/Gp68 family protein [Rhodopirellula sp.]
MGLGSHIEWTDATWNPVTGCTKLSPGCRHCYAERMAKRLQAMGQRNYSRGFQPTLHENSLTAPLKWRSPRRIFVNSMGDLFHEDVPLEFILKTFDVMRRANWHQYQILTKRAARLEKLDPHLPWAPHIWMGVTVESSEYQFRIDHLRRTHAYIRFLSFEPLLGPVEPCLSGISWVIVGGESGAGARPMQSSWVIDLRDRCRAAHVAFFFKQWGGVNRKRAGRMLEGRTWDEMPNPNSPPLPGLPRPIMRSGC